MSKADLSPVQLERLYGPGPFVFVCEHASCRIPDEYQNLGVSAEVARSHAAWDIGALSLSMLLSKRFDSPLVASTVSRLVYDCNRSPDSDTAFVVRSEFDDVPGNLTLTDEQRRQRVDTIYQPFSDQLSELLDHRLKSNINTTLVTIHSFTPTMRGKPRAVEVGVLHDSDRRFADQLLVLAPEHPHYVIERNQPYGPDDDVTHTLKVHAIPRRINNVMLEVRNDLLDCDESIEQIGELLFRLLSGALQHNQSDTDNHKKGPV